MLDRVAIEHMATKAGDSPILIALSGGGDSVALMHMLRDAAPSADLRAVVIDHALRVGSNDDAERAAGFARKLGLPVEVIVLKWADGANRAHEAARGGRYAALCGAARRCGARVIAAGHTRDDQAETVMLRAQRGSGLRGLAGMRALAPAPIWPEGRDLVLARPLLGARRVELRRFLEERGAAWLEDPANEKDVYARVRVRRALAELEATGFDPMRLAALAERLAPHVAAIDGAAIALIEAAASFADDEIVVSREAWVGDLEVKRRALAALITAAGAHARGPSAAQIAAFDGMIEEKGFEGFTLAGARVRERRGAIVFSRDPGALSGRADGAPPLAPLILPAGQETVWDARVALTMPEPGWSVVADGDKPQLRRGETRLPLAAASPHWLVRNRVQHVLGHD